MCRCTQIPGLRMHCSMASQVMESFLSFFQFYELSMLLNYQIYLNFGTVAESKVRDRSFFMRERGLVGFGKHHLKIEWPPPQLTNFFTWPPLRAVIFLDDPPLKIYPSLLFPYLTLFCSLSRRNLQSLYYAELFS